MAEGATCGTCGGWVDYSDLGSVAYHEHDGRPEPWGIKGVEMQRRKYRMSDADLATLREASKPVLMIAMQCGAPTSPQQNANVAWAALGKKMGFAPWTVQPDGPDQRDFTALEYPGKEGA